MKLNTLNPNLQTWACLYSKHEFKVDLKARLEVGLSEPKFYGGLICEIKVKKIAFGNKEYTTD